MKFTETEAIQIIKDREQTEKWVTEAREKHAELKALVTGEGFGELLIKKIEKLESEERSKARQKYAKDIRDLFYRVMKKRDNVFQANGGSENIKIKNESILKEFNNVISSFKSNKSIFKYLSEYFFDLLDTDPNGVIFLEYMTTPEVKLYPTYKSIKDIHFYEPNGQLCEYIIFKPTVSEATGNTIWRIVDDVTDWTIVQNSGIYIVNKEKTFEHPFGKVPALILSDREKVGTNLRLSPINPVEELAKDYARDKSIRTIYKFQNGFPIHWRYVSQCKKCTGTGKSGGGDCGACTGKGYLAKADVTDMVTLNMPTEKDQPLIAPDLAGFISPDLETWTKYNEDLRDMERQIDDTIWGTDKTQEQDKTTSETATGRHIDVQPMTNTLNKYTDSVEYVYNTMANWVLNFVDPTKPKDEQQYLLTFGRRYILESPDVVLEKYQLAKTKGDNNTILDKLLEEFVLSKYKSDPHMQETMLKKIQIEPYIHNSTTETNTLYGAAEALKKTLFTKFWETADKTKPAESLSTEFKTYFKNESSEVLSALAEAQRGEKQGAV